MCESMCGTFDAVLRGVEYGGKDIRLILEIGAGYFETRRLYRNDGIKFRIKSLIGQTITVTPRSCFLHQGGTTGDIVTVTA